MPDVTFQASASSVEALVGYIAQQEGFFAQQGLTVDYQDKASFPSDSVTAALLSGSYQFVTGIATTTMAAAQKDGGLKAIASVDNGGKQEIAITTSVASSLHISTAGATSDQSLAQLMALKGSHLKVAVTGFTSGTYNNLVTLCAEHGLTCKQNDSSADIDILSAGNVANLTAGLASGSYPAIAGGEPFVVQPDTLAINMGNIAPVSTGALYQIITSTSMIKSHPDTVQAFTKAIVQSWEWAQKNKVDAEKLFTQMEAQINDVTDQHEDQYLFNDFYTYWTTPMLPVSAFNEAVHIASVGQPGSPITLTYGQWNDTSFVTKAVKQLGVQVPDVS
jgi:ABC-type nitrate/sulfonate/bicarbonate transport system substrate-binding protein